MPEIKSYAIELNDRPPVYVQHGEQFNINNAIVIVDHDQCIVRMFFPDDIISIKEGVFNEH